MLQQMRDLSKSWFATILMGMLALAFAFWGIGDIFQGRTETTVATVGDVSIPQEQFQREYRNEIRAQSAQTGTDITPEMARTMGLGDEVLQRMITRAALDNLVRKLGLTASDDAVSSQIKNMQAFRGPLGTFDKATFARAINEAGFTEQSFIEAVRADTSRSQLVQAVTDKFAMPEGYSSALFAYQEEYRAASYIILPSSQAGTVAAPTDDQLKAYVKAHQAAFSTPEYREVTVAGIAPADVMGGLSVTDKQLHDAYDAKKATYVVPEKRDVEQINFKNEAAAKAAYGKITSGGSFADAATAAGMKPNELSIGTLTKADLDKARGDAVFAVADGGVTAPVKGPFGWVMMKVTKITPGSSKPFDTVKDELKADLLKQLAGGKLIDVANAYQDAVDSGFTIQEAAKKAGMKVVHIAAVDKSGLMPDGKKADLFDDPELMEQIFKAEVGEEGEPFQTKLGNYYAVKVVGVTPPEPKPLDAVRAQATEEWTARARDEALEKKAASLAEKAQKDNSLDAIAKEAGVKVEASGALQRGTQSKVLSPALLQKLFAKPSGTVVYAPAASGDAYIIARTTGVVHPAPPLDNPAYRSGVNGISSTMANDLVMSLAAAAEKKQGSKIYPDMVNSVVGSEGS